MTPISPVEKCICAPWCCNMSSTKCKHTLPRSFKCFDNYASATNKKDAIATSMHPNQLLHFNMHLKWTKKKQSSHSLFFFFFWHWPFDTLTHTHKHKRCTHKHSSSFKNLRNLLYAHLFCIDTKNKRNEAIALDAFFKREKEEMFWRLPAALNLVQFVCFSLHFFFLLHCWFEFSLLINAIKSLSAVARGREQAHMIADLI